MFFQLGIQQGHPCFTVTLVNSKCIANVLGKFLCFLAKSRKLFFRLEKLIFTLQVTCKQFVGVLCFFWRGGVVWGFF